MTRRRIAGIVITALAVGIITTTAAARPIDPYSAVPSGAHQSTVRSSELAAYNAVRQQALANHVPPNGRYSTAGVGTYAAVTPPTASTPGNGFEWGDAAIGAAAATVITLMIGAATLAARQRSQPRLP